jgi:deoxyribodipyrimidine photolyase-like uncharacterized protein
MQGSQSKTLRLMTNAPWYVTNQTLHEDLTVSYITEVIQERSIKHHGKIKIHSNNILWPQLEQQHTRILKLVVCILLRVLGQFQGFRLTQHWFEYFIQ